MNPGNNQMIVNREYDTGKKWIDGSPIFKKLIDFGTLPLTSTKNVNHNAAVVNNKMARVSQIIMRPAAGGTYSNIPLPSLTDIKITTTQIQITTSADLTAISAWVEIEYCK